MSKIQDYDWLYDMGRYYVDWLFRHSYRSYHCLGREHIPTDGAIIYAPNHANALMDALAVLSIDHSPKVFAARADMFRHKRLAAFLHWLKIMPIARGRDGLEALRHSDQTTQAAIEVLSDRVPYCIFAEGTHRTKHSLLPITKGIFRIACQAAQQLDGQMPVYIVPVGLEYGDYYHLWNSLIIRIGEPINVTDYMQTHTAMTLPQMYNALPGELHQRLSQQILYVPDDQQYEEHWQALQNDLPEPYKSLRMQVWPRWARGLFLTMGAPLMLLATIYLLPILIVDAILVGRMQDKAFTNSVCWVVNWLLMPFTLMTALPVWWFWQEYSFQWRQ